jgi:hypothetical protein
MLTNTSAISESIRDNPEISGVFPRWISLGTVSNAYDMSLGETGSFVAYGVSFLTSDIYRIIVLRETWVWPMDFLAY